MRIFAIGDLHLSLEDGLLKKPMDVFGEQWCRHHETMAEDWVTRVGEDDLVLVPGDLSWGKDLMEVEEDLDWLDAMPGTKVLVKGNHDWWWSGSIKKLRDAMPPTVKLIQHDCLAVEDVLLFGTRYWQDLALEFPGQEDIHIAPLDESPRILEREIGRLMASVALAEEAEAGRSEPFKLKLCLLHFPPTDLRSTRTQATEILSRHGADGCVFGHIHNLTGVPERIEVDGIPYWPVSCDLIDFKLREVADV